MLKIGAFLQDRYEIIGRVGSGGMADVYKAKDHKLNRYVAIKVLKREFREDKAFLAKFRTEAQSAAGLSHPNIVNVYDVGQDANVGFIVMELVEGITLKAYIEKKGRLTVREATSIAIQVSMGLDAAHKNHIVHRDVKPQNIIISTDGKVKVTDFGIARAATSNTINSSVMGSVHYSSPEQARGGYSDYKSDIYSLGITMYEMVTGHVPFDGESTVAIAIKHLQEEIQTPRKYVPDLPLSLEQIILKCTQKSPDRRYNNMEELIRDLKESLVNPEGDFVRIAPALNTAQTVVISKEELERIQQGAHTEGRPAEPVREEPGYGNYAGGDQEEYGYRMQEQMYGRDAGYQKEEQEEAYQRKRRSQREDYSSGWSRLLTAGTIVVGLLILAIAVMLVGNALGLFDVSVIRGKLFGGHTVGRETETAAQTESDSETETESETLGVIQKLTGATEEDSAEEVVISDVRGKTAAEAESELTAAGLKPVNGGTRTVSGYDAGEVCALSPAAGSSVKKGTSVTYYLSDGTSSDEPVEVPNVAAIPEADALKQLTAAGLKADCQYYVNANVPEGYVIYTMPAGGETVDPGSTVTVYVSKVTSGTTDGSQNNNGNTTPAESNASQAKDYTGQQASDAIKSLESEGYTVVYESVVDPNVPYGQIISQTQEGKTITIRISVGSGDPSDPNSATEAIETFGSDESKVSGEEDEDEGVSYTAAAALREPDGYDGQPVRIEVKQGSTVTTLVDGSVVEFPYKIEMKSGSGTTGKVTLYLLDPDTYEVEKTFNYQSLKFTAETEG